MDENRTIKDIKYNHKRKRNSSVTENVEIERIIEFVKRNARYFIAGILFILIIIVAAFFINPKEQQTGAAANTEERQEEAFQENAYPELNQLIEAYYTAYAAGETETLKTLADPVSERELGYISLFSQYVECYQNMICYTKSGLDAGSYLVNVYVDVKFEGVDTLAPGLDFFYVRTREDGTLYIDNLYSQYNYKNMDNALDKDVDNLIKEFQQQEDVIALLNSVQAKFDETVAADANLANILNVTIPEAISNWMAELVAQNPDLLPEAVETEMPVTEVPETEVPETEVPETEVPEPETPDSQETEPDGLDSKLPDSQAAEPEPPEAAAIPEGTVITLQESTNIRESMSTESDKVGTAYQGEKVTVVMSYAEGWTKVKWNNKTGYIRTDLLQ